MDEVRVIFDRYDMANSLKRYTRERRRGTHTAVAHSTNIGKVPMKRLLSDVRTKTELTQYLSEKLLLKVHTTGKEYVVAWGWICKS